MDEEAKRLAEEEAAKAADPAAETKTDPVDDGIDYAAELERVKKQLGQAEHTIITLKKKNKEDDPDDNGDDDKDKVKIEDEIQKIREEQKVELDKLKVDLVKDNVSDILSSMTTNQAERDLIKFNYENKIVKSGFDKDSIREDLTSARLLANRSKLEKTITELKYTLDSEKGKNKGGSATGQDVDTKTTKLSASEETWVKQHALRTGIPEDKVRAKLIANKS